MAEFQSLCTQTTAPDDPFSSFPSVGQPPSLASHWIPNTQVNGKKSIGTLGTFRTHYVRIPNPGDEAIESESLDAAACENCANDQVQDDYAKKSLHPVVEYIGFLLQNKSEDKQLDRFRWTDLDGVPEG